MSSFAMMLRYFFGNLKRLVGCLVSPKSQAPGFVFGMATPTGHYGRTTTSRIDGSRKKWHRRPNQFALCSSDVQARQRQGFGVARLMLLEHQQALSRQVGQFRQASAGHPT